MTENQIHDLQKIKKLGIMGGSFNPPHIGHFIMAETALSELSLDKIMFVPTGKIKYKPDKEMADGVDRLEMLKSVVDSNMNFYVSDMEVTQSETTYTANTLARLKKILPETEIYFIVGADSLDYMDKWFNPQMIFDNCIVAAMKRNSISDEQFNEKITFLKEQYEAEIVLADMPMIEVSSTMIRENIRKSKPIKYLTDDRVIEYIESKNLYK